MSAFPETNYTLIDRVKDIGDGASWIEFLGIYQPVVYRMARPRAREEGRAGSGRRPGSVAICRMAGRARTLNPSTEEPFKMENVDDDVRLHPAGIEMGSPWGYVEPRIGTESPCPRNFKLRGTAGTIGELPRDSRGCRLAETARSP